MSSAGLSGYPTTRSAVDVVHDKVDAVVQIELVYDKVHEGGLRGTNYVVDFVVNYGEGDYSVIFVVNYTVPFVFGCSR